MSIKSSSLSDKTLSLPSFPILMESKRGSVFMFLDPKKAVCLLIGSGSEWKVGETKTASMIGMELYKGMITLEND